MNTFLPFADFLQSAKCLDKRRCFKQVVETYQILNTLRGNSEGWKNHPVIRMWKSYEDCLQWYYNIFYQYCLDIHKINFQKLPKPCLLPKYMKYPPWLGYEPLHHSHRANLLRKSIEDLSKGRLELSQKLFQSGISITDYNLNEPYLWPIDKIGNLII